MLICFQLLLDPVCGFGSTGIFSPMKQTPSAMIFDNLSKPTKFSRSNNLVRKAGSFKLALGEPLYIRGKITDAFGVPIDGVIVKIWQTNAAGKYHSLLQKNSKYIDRNFLMSGQSVTDNTGRYEFITIFPGFYDDRAPHINIIVSHRRFGIIETEMYFDGNPKNSRDPIYLVYPEDDRKLLTATVKSVSSDDPSRGKIAVFNIVMDGLHQYKRY
jgi:protocatechuate 3,4-dioxygenase beta subunit